MNYPSRVKIIDVGPRDGLQNEKQPVPTEVKLGLIQRLEDAGLKEIEVTSFVSPKWVPQMADNAQVMHGLRVVGHLRHPLGADEAGDLDLLQARILQALDEAQLDLGGHRLLLVLQAVARADVDDLHAGGVVHDGWPLYRMRIVRRAQSVATHGID